LAAAAEGAALIFRQSTPYTNVLIGLKRPLQAVSADLAVSTDGLGALDLAERRAAGAEREKQFGLSIQAGSLSAPFHGHNDYLRFLVITTVLQNAITAVLL
jgi:hypothetical protein